MAKIFTVFTVEESPFDSLLQKTTLGELGSRAAERLCWPGPLRVDADELVCRTSSTT
jgi:hypothetical protein